MNLTDDQLKAWQAKLRSGHYLQTTGILVNRLSDRYCCMGVCGLVLGLSPSSMQELTFLPPIDGEKALTSNEALTFSRLNDRYGLTFSQIAAFIDGAEEKVWKSIGPAEVS